MRISNDLFSDFCFVSFPHVSFIILFHRSFGLEAIISVSVKPSQVISFKEGPHVKTQLFHFFF